MYAFKNQEEDKQFVERSSVIKRMRPYDIMTYLGLKEKFLLGEDKVSSRISCLNFD